MMHPHIYIYTREDTIPLAHPEKRLSDAEKYLWEILNTSPRVADAKIHTKNITKDQINTNHFSRVDTTTLQYGKSSGDHRPGVASPYGAQSNIGRMS